MESEFKEIVPPTPDAGREELIARIAELTAAVNRMRPISTDDVEVLATDAGAVYKAGPAVEQIINEGGLPAGYTFEEFTICDSGTPVTRWWPTWLTNPEA